MLRCYQPAFRVPCVVEHKPPVDKSGAAHIHTAWKTRYQQGAVRLRATTLSSLPRWRLLRSRRGGVRTLLIDVKVGRRVHRVCFGPHYSYTAEILSRYYKSTSMARLAQDAMSRRHQARHVVPMAFACDYLPLCFTSNLQPLKFSNNRSPFSAQIRRWAGPASISFLHCMAEANAILLSVCFSPASIGPGFKAEAVSGHR